MSGINKGRVIGGGLVAAVVIELGAFLLDRVLLADRVAEFTEAQGLSAPSAGVYAFNLLLVLAIGIVTVWLYAAIRPRFGPGPRTAAVAGVVVWLLLFLFPLAFLASVGVLPGDYALIACVWSLVEVPLAAVAGAWLYVEEAGAAAS